MLGFRLKYISVSIFVLANLMVEAQKRASGPAKNLGKKITAGLSYIPPKTFNSLVYTGEDSVSTYRSKIVSVSGFYISRTEVTNKEYREFVHYVRDSIAHVLLLHFKEGSNEIDWKQNINWNDKNLEPLFLPPDERLYGRKDIDPLKLIYPLDFFGKQETIGVHPDTLVWINDFTYSNNEPLVKKYFSKADYDDFPVVGISLKQAMAFCDWKTKRTHGLTFRIPTNAEWESAAIGEKQVPGVQNAAKIYPCNFGTIPPRHGASAKGYADDGFYYTAPVKSFPPVDYGLYDIQGNVSEWTITSIDEIMNVEVRKEKEKTVFIVKGGGWNNSPFYLQPGVCQFYSCDAAKTWIGFRYVAEVNKD